MKNIVATLVAIVAVGALSTTPAYASQGRNPFCNIPFIGRYLCPPAPGEGGGPTSVPEPATLAVLAIGACAAALATRRRRRKPD